jgi:hypothetical protein
MINGSHPIYQEFSLFIHVNGPINCTNQCGTTLVHMSRVLLGNTHLEGLRVDRILQANTRDRIPNKWGERFNQVWGP